MFPYHNKRCITQLYMMRFGPSKFTFGWSKLLIDFKNRDNNEEEIHMQHPNFSSKIMHGVLKTIWVEKLFS